MTKKDKELFKFKVLWLGWEMDNDAWIMERANGTRYIKMTDHGREYIASVGELEERVTNYLEVLEETKEAIKLLNGE